MENLNFNFATVIGLLGVSFGLCVYIFNRAVLDIEDLKEWQMKQDERLEAAETTIEKINLCFSYIKRDLDDIKKEMKK